MDIDDGDDFAVGLTIDSTARDRSVTLSRDQAMTLAARFTDAAQRDSDLGDALSAQEAPGFVFG